MIYSALSLKINAKITILFHINDFFVFIFQKISTKLLTNAVGQVTIYFVGLLKQLTDKYVFVAQLDRATAF